MAYGIPEASPSRDAVLASTDITVKIAMARWLRNRASGKIQYFRAGLPNLWEDLAGQTLEMYINLSVLSSRVKFNAALMEKGFT